MLKILFLCTGNICRSPTAEGILRARIATEGLGGRLSADSAGIQGYHEGDPPDPRSMRTAQRFGIDLSALRARRVTPQDLDLFDIIAVMESLHRRQLLALRAEPPRAEVRLLMSYTGQELAVPDPYGDDALFEPVFRLIEQGVDALFNQVRKRVTDSSDY